MCVDTDSETDAAKEGKRCPAPASDSDELVPATPRRGDEGRHGADHGLSSQPSRPSHGNLRRRRPWTQQDTDLSKALTRVLRHRSSLHLDEEGYARITDVLDHPITRPHRPTTDWIKYIVQANAKQRFALNAKETHVRAVQGHSVPVDSSRFFRQLDLEDFGTLVPEQALHSTYYARVPSILQHGLLPGGSRGERFRRHVHLAASRNPTAGLRSGSEVILEIDLARAHNSGCTFFLSENGVLLTEDAIPPPCIVRATRTDSGGVYELRRFRAAYKRVCAASGLPLPIDMSPCCFPCIGALTAQHMMPPFGRFTSSSRTALSYLICLQASRHSCNIIRRPSIAFERRAWTLSLDAPFSVLHAADVLPRGQAVLIARRSIWQTASYPSSAAYRRPDFPGAPLSRVLGLPAELLLPHAMDADLTWNLFRLWTVMQSGTPVGQERQYSWKPTAGRLVVTTPPAGDASDDQQASSATPLVDSLDFKDSESHRTRRAGMQTRLPGRPRPTMAPRLLAEATTQKRPSYAVRSPDGPTGYSAGTEPDGPATPLPRKRSTAYYADDSLSEGSPDTVGADAACHRTEETGCPNSTWYEDTSPCSPVGHTTCGISVRYGQAISLPPYVVLALDPQLFWSPART